MIRTDCYIADWDAPTANADKVFDEVSPYFNHTAILLARNVPCAEQWEEARWRFMQTSEPEDIFVWTMADVRPNRMLALCKRMSAAFERGDIAMYAPNVDYTSQRYNVQKCNQVIPGLFEVCGTDLLFCALTRELLERLPPLGPNIRAWSYDYLMTHIANKELHKLVVRDYNFTFGHYGGSSYSQWEALEGYAQWFEMLSPEHQKGIDELRERQAELCA